MYVVVKYKIDLHSLRNRQEKLDQSSLLYLFLMLVQTNYIFSDIIFCKNSCHDMVSDKLSYNELVE